MYPLEPLFGLGFDTASEVGLLALTQVLSGKLGWKDAFFDFLNDKLDFGVLGYIIVAMFLVAWIGSVLLWKARRVEERYGDAIASPES